MRVGHALATLLVLMLVVGIAPVHAAIAEEVPNRGTLHGVIDFDFSPRTIPVGGSTTLTISVTAPQNESIYVFFFMQTEHWLRFQTSGLQTRMGDFGRGGLVLVSYLQNWYSDTVQFAVVALANTTVTLKVPIYASQAGVFRFVDVYVYEGLVVNGGMDIYLGTHYANFVNFNVGLTVYDSQLGLLVDRLTDIDGKLNRILAIENLILDQFGIIKDGFAQLGQAIQSLTVAISSGFEAIGNQHDKQIATITDQHNFEVTAIIAQLDFLVRLIYLLFVALLMSWLAIFFAIKRQVSRKIN